MLPIQEELLSNRKNRPFLRDAAAYSLREIRGVIAHWTANTRRGADAKAHVKYFNTTDRFASAHYIVDDHSIYQCIPDSEVAYHVGGQRYLADGERLRKGAATPNYFVIGFEMCVNEDGDWDKTYQHSAELAAHLLHKYQFSVHDLYRHHDMTGKDCPKMMLTAETWGAFKEAVALELAKFPQPRTAIGKVNAGALNVRTGPGVNNKAVTQLSKDALVEVFSEQDGWVNIGPDRWVNKRFVDVLFTTQRARVNAATGAVVRASASATGKIVEKLPNRAFLNLLNRSGEWYTIGEGRWVQQDQTEIIPEKTGIVTGAAELNVRFGPGTEWKIVRKLPAGSKVRILGEQGDWLQIGFSEWVFGRFIV